ncbi:hypothetical protein ABBQ32_009574 [Trebouxia sp. C0010 RCD-2024]
MEDPHDEQEPQAAPEQAEQDELEREREQQQAAKLLECEKLFTEPDSIMEPDILEVLKRYLELGGSPQNGVDFLIDKYVGYGQMASLVCSWISKTDQDAQASTSEQADEVTHMQALIADKFDPDKVDSLLRTRRGPPKWLTPLIADKAGRELIYTLSARYKNCQLLKYAMQRILKAGHDDEIGSVGSRLAGYFEVFHNLMVKRLEDMLTADYARVQALSRELLEICCNSQHTYAHAQQLLQSLGAHPNGARFKRLSQDMEVYAAEKLGYPIAWKMHQFFLGSQTSVADAEVAATVADLLAADKGHTRSLIPKLHKLYCNTPDAQQIPPMHLLQHPKVFEILVQGLFDPTQRLPAETQRTYVQLLATAAAAVDNRQEGGTVDLAEVAQHEAALQDSITLANQAASGDRFTKSQLEQAATPLQVPCAAMGLLHTMEATLLERRVWSGALDMLPAPAFLTLLLLLVPVHPLLHTKIVGIIGAVLVAMGSKTDYATGFLDVVVYLMQQGCVTPALRMISSWASTGSADPMLVRHFIFRCLLVCAPPYSAYFTNTLLRLMLRCGIKRGRIKDDAEVRLLQQFWASSHNANFQPPLGQQEAAMLQQLASIK